MEGDLRADVAKYYDYQPSPFGGEDIPFYIALLPHPAARVLELGCGTGRVLVAMAAHCGYIHGIDLSKGMLAICREKLAQGGIGPERAQVEAGDICRLQLGRQFDLITAPFRVFQNLELDEQIDGLFRTVRAHLAPGGSCVLNAFRPWGDEASVRQLWATRGEERERWQRTLGSGRVVGCDRISRVHPSQFICYPTLTFRYYEGDLLKEEAAVNIAMRCYDPEAFERLIVERGFRVLRKWGGYNGEAYGEGPELVVQFTHAATPDQETI